MSSLDIKTWQLIVFPQSIITICVHLTLALEVTEEQELVGYRQSEYKNVGYSLSFELDTLLRCSQLTCFLPLSSLICSSLRNIHISDV